jgi:hypothetical protein
MRARIFTFYHYIPDFYVANDLYRPMVIGQKVGAHPVLLSDETGDNIAHENSHAEMRGHYHVWKNSLSNYDFVGFQHYRRWLFFDQMPSTVQQPLFQQIRRFCLRDPHFNDLSADETVFRQYMDIMQHLSVADLDAIRDTIGRYDIITVRPWKFSVADQYRQICYARDWDILIDILGKHSRFRSRPNYYDPELQAFYSCNMFVMSAAEFDAYMSFWHETMLEFSHLVKPYEDKYQSRVYGFIAERIFTLYLFQLRMERPNLRVLEVPKIVGPQKI